MSLNVVMQVYVEDRIDDETLSRLRVELLVQFDLTGEDFYFESDSGSGIPLVFVPREDYELAGLEGEPGDLLNVNFWHSYYGVGYERGDLLLFITTAEWLEERLPGCRLFYGPDSTGETRPFDAPERARIRKYFEQVGHEPYRRKDLSHAEWQALFGEALAQYNA
jgi:hypothetical protein